LKREYVLASQALGASFWHQIKHHMAIDIFRLMLPLLGSLGSTYLAIIASLQFLGAFTANQISVGVLVYEALGRLQQAPWIAFGAFFRFSCAWAFFKA
jgi:ABC-type dipeptide/oligopeptide/nickel transport system permease subunit